MSGHTEGPWKAHLDMDGRHRHIAVLTEAPEWQAEEWPYHPKIVSVHTGVHSTPRGIAEANARLIAASPDMLAALKGLLADIEDYQRINNLGGEENHWQVLARAAIAKADPEIQS